jgi:hypothetical protein
MYYSDQVQEGIVGEPLLVEGAMEGIVVEPWEGDNDEDTNNSSAGEAGDMADDRTIAVDNITTQLNKLDAVKVTTRSGRVIHNRNRLIAEIGAISA